LRRLPDRRSGFDRLLDVEHKNLAVADAAGAGGVLDRFDDIIDEAVLDHHLDLHLGQEVDHIFGAAVELGMALLPAEALHFGHGNARDADLVKRVLHIVELEGLDDRFDLLHVGVPMAINANAQSRPYFQGSARRS